MVFEFVHRTQDCVNGTLIKEITVPQPSINFTSFLSIYEKSLQYPVDPTNSYVPAQRSLTIYNSSRLYINLEGCVNTLKGECKDFLVSHGRDGDNQTAQSRYPCYYNKVRCYLLPSNLRCNICTVLRSLSILQCLIFAFDAWGICFHY